MSTDEESGMSEGVKVTMFDILDRADVKEEATLVLDDLYRTNAAYDYKSVLVDAAKNRIGFSGYSQNGEIYCLLTYNEKRKEIRHNSKRRHQWKYFAGCPWNIYRRYTVCDQWKYY